MSEIETSVIEAYFKQEEPIPPETEEFRELLLEQLPEAVDPELLVQTVYDVARDALIDGPSQTPMPDAYRTASATLTHLALARSSKDPQGFWDEVDGLSRIMFQARTQMSTEVRGSIGQGAMVIINRFPGYPSPLEGLHDYSEE